MIDTIKVCIPLTECKISNPDIFTPPAKGFLKPPYYSFRTKCICNPDKHYAQNGIYFPKLTIYKSHDRIVFLAIEFSAPKSAYGNNFDELTDEDFPIVIDNLLDRLNRLDIKIERKNLESAKILAVHYSKNIKLENITTSCITNIIAKLDVSKRLDIAKTDYKNGGQIVRFHTNSYELAFYDKVADLQQAFISEKRAFESDNYIQKDLLEKLLGCEILRMEVRLNSRKKLRKIFEKCNIETDSLNFNKLFSSEISKKVLNQFWNEYVEKSIHIVCQSENDTNVLFSKCLSAGFEKAKSLKIIGILSNIKETGCRITKEIVSNSAFSSFKKSFELLNLEDNYLLKAFKAIRSNLKKMIPLSIQGI